MKVEFVRFFRVSSLTATPMLPGRIVLAQVSMGLWGFVFVCVGVCVLCVCVCLRVRLFVCLRVVLSILK